MSRSYKLGLVARQPLGKAGALLGEFAWLNTETRFVSRFFTGNNQDFDKDQFRFRIRGWHLAVLYQQSLLTERKFRPLLEFGMGVFLPNRVRTDNNTFDRREWETVDGALLRQQVWRPTMGIGIQHQDRFFLTLRFSVVTGDLLEREPLRCANFCPQEEDITRPRTGLHTQLLQLTYLW